MPAPGPSLLAGLTLERRPRSRDESLRAWDGADALLMDHLARTVESGEASMGAGGGVLVVNDAFGAVTVGVAALGLGSATVWTDSHVAMLATVDNLAANGRTAEPAVLVPSTAEPSGPFHTVLLRVPRATRLLAHQVAVLALRCPGARVLAAGMDKHLPERTRAELEVLGPVTTHPGVRRAHVFEVVVDGDAAARALEVHRHDGGGGASIAVPGLPVSLDGGIGVFSSERLDLGARVLVDALLANGLPDGERVLDLGCGNGVLGCTARVLRPSIELTMVDESYEAVAVAARNHAAVAAALGGEVIGPVDCRVDDGLTGHEGPPFDVVVCNPPFHQQHVVDDALAWSMLSGVRHHLAPGGTLVVVANRHLGWHDRLRRLLPSVHQVASHPKFVVLAARGGAGARPTHRR